MGSGRAGMGQAGLWTAGVLGVAGGLAVTHAAPGLTGLRPVRMAGFPRLAGAGWAGHVALTFDDGPDPAATPHVLGLLAARGVRATFFMLGEQAARAPGLAAEVAAAGHEVAVHGWDHRCLLLRGPRATWTGLARARDTIEGLTGQAPRYFRPSYGVLSAAALAAAWRLRLRPVLWTAWGREWDPGASPDTVWATLRTGLDGGGTVLLHDSDCTSPPGSWRAALGALPYLLDECGRRGLQPGPLAEHGPGLAPSTAPG